MGRRALIDLGISRMPMRFFPLPTDTLYLLVVSFVGFPAQIQFPFDLAPVSIKLGKYDFVSFIHWEQHTAKKENYSPNGRSAFQAALGSGMYFSG